MMPANVSLFVTCLVDLCYPEVGRAAAALLRDAGVSVSFREGQTCCGQPAYTAGFPLEARRMARRTLDAFRGGDPVVVPSGSCAAMIRCSYPTLFRGEPEERPARQLAGRTHELSAFLVDVLGLERIGGRLEARATYHDGCHGLRELGLGRQGRRLLAGIEGLELVEMERADACCGFGGTFSVRLPGLATTMADEKLAHAARTGATLLVSGDAGCLMHLGGRLSRTGPALRPAHLAEVLAEAGGLG